ncbi:hypothetical protein ACJZ2D_016989 [Fusarium nematophilum]
MDGTPNCTSLQSLGDFNEYLEQLRTETNFVESNLTQCQKEICLAIWGGGNPDILGIGISIGYVVEITLGLGLASAAMSIREKHGQKWAFLQSVTTAGFEAFFDCAIYFAISFNIAAIVVLVNKDFGISTAGFGASEAEIALAMSVACILPLIYPAGLLPIRLSSPERLEESAFERDSDDKQKTQNRRLLLFSLLAVLFLYPFVSQAIHNWAPSRIGEGNGPGGETLVTNEEFERVQGTCFGTVERFASRETRLLAATEMAASLLIYLFMIWHLIIAQIRRMEFEEEDIRRITANLLRIRRQMEALWERYNLVRALFLFIPAALDGILLYCIFRLRNIQGQMAQELDGQYAGNEWGFGQIVSIVILGKEEDSTTLRIHGAAPVSREERRIIAVTGLGGIMKGVLIPGTTFLGKANQQQPQKLHIVQLDAVVAEGDSGIAVVDETSGDLYGYMISGCPGTRVAYIVPATDVFEDLGTELNGQVSIVSARKMQKSPRTLDRNEQKINLTNHQPQDAYSRDEPLDHHHRADATSTVGSRQTYGCTKHNLRQGRRISSMYKAWDSLFSGPPSLDVPLRMRDIYHSVQRTWRPFLGDVPLTRLLREECCYRRVALIDDRCGDGEHGTSRINRGPLTAYDLYHELSKPRLCTGSTRKLGLHEEPDAERRVIYVTNIDHRSVAALLATVSMSEAPAVASLIEKHLEWRSSLQVSISPRVYPMFLLEFHFPFFIWRTGKVRFEDHRRGADGGPLRKALDVSFLHAGSSNAAPSDGRDYLSEAQISCVVTGYSNRIWTAYGLVDTYFDPESCDDAANFYENLGFEDDEELDEYKLDLMTPISRCSWTARLFTMKTLIETVSSVDKTGPPGTDSSEAETGTGTALPTSSESETNVGRHDYMANNVAVYVVPLVAAFLL